MPSASSSLGPCVCRHDFHGGKCHQRLVLRPPVISGVRVVRESLTKAGNKHLSVVPAGFSVARRSSATFKQSRSKEESSNKRERQKLAHEKS